MHSHLYHINFRIKNAQQIDQLMIIRERREWLALSWLINTTCNRVFILRQLSCTIPMTCLYHNKGMLICNDKLICKYKLICKIANKVILANKLIFHIGIVYSHK